MLSASLVAFLVADLVAVLVTRRRQRQVFAAFANCLNAPAIICAALIKSKLREQSRAEHTKANFHNVCIFAALAITAKNSQLIDCADMLTC